MATDGACERVACSMALAVQSLDRSWPRRRGLPAQLWVMAGPKAMARRLALSQAQGNRFGTGLAGKRIFHIGSARKTLNGPIAQLDRVTDFYSVGCRFESCWDRHYQNFP